jgi:ABC-2 type transport system ATP-binding protein
MSNTIVAKDLRKRYGDVNAVDGVSLTVEDGEFFGILGPNGAGKTTTLRMLLGLVRPTSGTATVLGRAAGAGDVGSHVGALVEGPGFFPYLSGRQNLRMLARYRGLPDGSAAAEGALERVDLADRGDDRFKTYSLGMKQRLGVAAALLGDPELIVLDEPTNGLDPAGMADMRALVVALAHGGQTVVLSSHLLAEVQEICDRVGVIDNGRLLRESTVSELRGGTSLRVRARPFGLAEAVARRAAGPAGVEIHDDVLELRLPAERAPDVVRQLVAEGADVLEVTTRERTLEEVFFELTGPGIGHARARTHDTHEEVVA